MCDCRCPFCQEVDDEDHFMQCTSSEARTKWTEEMQRFHDVLEHPQTHPEIADSFVNQLHQWHHHGNATALEHFSKKLLSTAKQQATVRWSSFVQGFWVKDQLHFQHSCHVSHELCTKKWTGMLWMQSTGAMSQISRGRNSECAFIE